MVDRDRARNILTRLRAGPVSRSCGRLRHGYSSLSYLCGLPIDELSSTGPLSRPWPTTSAQPPWSLPPSTWPIPGPAHGRRRRRRRRRRRERDHIHRADPPGLCPGATTCPGPSPPTSSTTGSAPGPPHQLTDIPPGRRATVVSQTSIGCVWRTNQCRPRLWIPGLSATARRLTCSPGTCWNPAIAPISVSEGRRTTST